VNYWEIIADNLKKPDGAWAGPQRLIPTGERSGSLTRIATVNASSFARMKSWPRLLNWNQRSALAANSLDKLARFFGNAPDMKQSIPLGDIPAWCSIREQVFSWTMQRFPFTVISGKTLELNAKVPKLITVVGKRFYDVDHAGNKHSNRRPGEPNKAVWEIHPVMEIETVETAN
jgi:hypothetical protein